MGLDSAAICCQSQVDCQPERAQDHQPLRFPPATTDYLDCLRPGTLVTLSVIALKEYWLKFSLVEEQTAQVTWVSLLVGVTVSPSCTALVSLLSVNQCPCWRLELLVLEKRMQAKGRRHSSLQLIGCSVTTRKRRRGGATKQLMGVCDKSVFTYKRGGGWGGPPRRWQAQV